IAYTTAQTLNRVRGDAFLLGPSEDQTASQLLQVTHDDALLVFTFPPYASTTLRIVREAKRQGATAIAITDSPISPAGQLVDVVLAVVASGISAQNSHVAAL